MASTFYSVLNYLDLFMILSVQFLFLFLSLFFFFCGAGD
jgi:hypothetical protein